MLTKSEPAPSVAKNSGDPPEGLCGSLCNEAGGENESGECRAEFHAFPNAHSRLKRSQTINDGHLWWCLAGTPPVRWGRAFRLREFSILKGRHDLS
jgi:hypothetical protein